MKKMIVINGRFLLHGITGVERNALELIRALDPLVKEGEAVLAVPPGVDKKKVPRCRNIRIVYAGRLKNILWEHISLPIYAWKHGAVTLNLCNTAPLPSPGIVCICDAKIKARPEFFSKIFLLWYTILMWNETRRARHILTISGFSRKELCRFYHLRKEKISVIPCAWQHYERIAEDESAPEKYGLPRGAYYFAMSSLEPNKNMDWILRTADRYPDSVFAVAGKTNESIFAKEKHSGIPGNVKRLGYISDEEAKCLIRYCKGFLYPSFYEGFGIPPLEALSAGANPVYVSDMEVMHEVFGNAAVYVDPLGSGEELGEWKKADEADIRNTLNKYSWHASAKRLYEILLENIR